MSAGNKKAWSGRFGQGAHRLAESFGASIFVDKRLYRQDIMGSKAHAKMLAQVGLVTPSERDQILAALEEIALEIERGEMVFSAAKEDIHLHIESRLIEKIGAVGGKLHTGRSRNDQVALDLRLYALEACDVLVGAIRKLQKSFVCQAEQNLSVIMPGYTHLQRAQPVLLAHHLLAYVEMLARDSARLMDARARASWSPLGAGALAGSALPLDRRLVACELGLQGPTANSMDSVADRDFAIEIAAALAILMMHLSRLAEELILWNSQEFGFIEFPDEWCTGSSMMPQKKNPDVPELVRGKTGRVYGTLMALLTLMKGLPLAYNKDMQEDKAVFFDAVDETQSCVEIMAEMLPAVIFKAENCLAATERGFLQATDLADYLVQKNIPFREAHEIVGQIVRAAIAAGKTLSELSLKQLQSYSKAITAEVHEVLKIAHVVGRRTTDGGTSPQCVQAALESWRQKLGM